LVSALIPHEYNDHLIENGVRQNAREGGAVVNRVNEQHREIKVTRGVLVNTRSNKDELSAASNVIDLGQTKVLGQAKIVANTQTVLSDEALCKSKMMMVTLSCEGEPGEGHARPAEKGPL